jgi:hypothetical protein
MAPIAIRVEEFVENEGEGHDLILLKAGTVAEGP